MKPSGYQGMPIYKSRFGALKIGRLKYFVVVVEGCVSEMFTQD